VIDAAFFVVLAKALVDLVYAWLRPAGAACLSRFSKVAISRSRPHRRASRARGRRALASLALGEVVGHRGRVRSGKTGSDDAVMRLIRIRTRYRGRRLLRGRNLMQLPQSEMRLVRGGEIG